MKDRTFYARPELHFRFSYCSVILFHGSASVSRLKIDKGFSQTGEYPKPRAICLARKERSWSGSRDAIEEA